MNFYEKLKSKCFIFILLTILKVKHFFTSIKLVDRFIKSKTNWFSVSIYFEFPVMN
jgi:hypothetical protein